MTADLQYGRVKFVEKIEGGRPRGNSWVILSFVRPAADAFKNVFQLFW